MQPQLLLVFCHTLCDFFVSFNLWDPAAKGFRPKAESSSVSNHVHIPISPWKPCAPLAWGKQNLCWAVDAAQASSSPQQVEGREPGDHQATGKYCLIGFSAFDVTRSSSSNALLQQLWRGEIPEMEQILLQAAQNTSHLRAVCWIGGAGRGVAGQITLKDKEHKVSNSFLWQIQNQPLLMLFFPCWVTGEKPHAAPLCLHTPLVIKSWAGAEQLQLYLSFYLLFCYLTSPRSCRGMGWGGGCGKSVQRIAQSSKTHQKIQKRFVVYLTDLAMVWPFYSKVGC